MKKLETVPFYVESEAGHDTVDVPKEKVAEEVNKQLIKGDSWVTLAKKDGTTKLMTQPQPLDKEQQKTNSSEPSKGDDWKKSFSQPGEGNDFEGVESATVTKKMRGG